jgi:hypothetical protein
VPTNRFTGAPTIAAHADELLAQLRTQTGQEPMVMAPHYGRAALLTFYMRGNPNVLCVSSLTGNRPTSWDFWESTVVAGNTSLLGRPALIVGGTEALWLKSFDSVRCIGPLRGDHRHDRPGFMALGFRGMHLPNDTPIAPTMHNQHPTPEGEP